MFKTLNKAPNEGFKLNLTTTTQQTEKKNNNKAAIILGECEEKLKETYHIPKEESLYILEIDYNQKYYNIPKIEYEVYYPLNGTMEKLNLSICDNNTIEIYIQVNLTEDPDIYNPFSDYYNDICLRATSDKGTDISLQDRKEEFLEKNLTLCETNCKFVEYDTENKRVKCECGIKAILSVLDEIEIDKEELKPNFKEIKKVSNIQIIKCFKKVFNVKHILKNYGFFIFTFILLLYIICVLLFLLKYYFSLKKEINILITSIMKQIMIKSGNINNNNNKDKQNKTKKIRNKPKRSKGN